MRTQGISLDVPAHVYKLRRPLDGVRVKTSLVHRPLADGLVVTMPADRVGSGDPLHERRELPGASRTHDEMPMVRHDAVGNQLHRMQRQALLEDREKGPIIGSIHEDPNFSDTAIDDMKK